MTKPSRFDAPLLALALGVLLSACASGESAPVDAARDADAGADTTIIRAYEGHACSTDLSEAPLYACTPTHDLVCISTYAVARVDGGPRSVYVCRQPCTPGGETCPQKGDVCCPGAIVGRGEPNGHGCVPSSICAALPPDGGSL